jgi:hypothetical protein
VGRLKNISSVNRSIGSRRQFSTVDPDHQPGDKTPPGEHQDEHTFDRTHARTLTPPGDNLGDLLEHAFDGVSRCRYAASESGNTPIRTHV